MIWHQSCSTGRVRSSKQSRSNFKKLEFQRPIPHKLMACISILHSLQFQSVLRSIAMPHHPTHVLGRCVLWVDVHYLLLVLFQNSFSSATFPIFYVHSCHLQRQNDCIGKKCIIDVFFSLPNLLPTFGTLSTGFLFFVIQVFVCNVIFIRKARYVAIQAHSFHLMRLGKNTWTFLLKYCGWSLFIHQVQSKFQNWVHVARLLLWSYGFASAHR